MEIGSKERLSVMNPAAWLVKATQPTPHKFITLERSRADDYARLHKGTIHRLVEEEEEQHGQTCNKSSNL